MKNIFVKIRPPLAKILDTPLAASRYCNSAVFKVIFDTILYVSDSSNYVDIQRRGNRIQCRLLRVYFLATWEVPEIWNYKFLKWNFFIHFLLTFQNITYLLGPKTQGFFPTKDLQTPPPSVLIRCLWMLNNVLERMKKTFSNFYFSSYCENSLKIGVIWV